MTIKTRPTCSAHSDPGRGNPPPTTPDKSNRVWHPRQCNPPMAPPPAGLRSRGPPRRHIGPATRPRQHSATLPGHASAAASARHTTGAPAAACPRLHCPTTRPSGPASSTWSSGTDSAALVQPHQPHAGLPQARSIACARLPRATCRCSLAPEELLTTAGVIPAAAVRSAGSPRALPRLPPCAAASPGSAGSGSGPAAGSSGGSPLAGRTLQDLVHVDVRDRRSTVGGHALMRIRLRGRARPGAPARTGTDRGCARSSSRLQAAARVGALRPRPARTPRRRPARRTSCTALRPKMPFTRRALHRSCSRLGSPPAPGRPALAVLDHHAQLGQPVADPIGDAPTAWPGAAPRAPRAAGR